MNKLLDYFENSKNLSHAFLIGNVVFDEIEDKLTKIISERIFNKNVINIKENPDIYYYDQGNEIITKDEVKELLSNLSKTSQFNNAKVYIINYSEKMSDTVANAILKTLEEPEENVYAFLITKNIEAVKETIKSRCQIIMLNSLENSSNYDDKDVEIALKLINALEENKVKSIALNYEIYNLIEDREKFKRILVILLEKYNESLKKILNNNKNNEENDEIIKNNDIISLSKKILVIDDFQKLLDSYLNKNLTIDRFIIEMWRCNK